jgi:hypothetical protein
VSDPKTRNRRIAVRIPAATDRFALILRALVACILFAGLLWLVLLDMAPVWSLFIAGMLYADIVIR